MLQTQKIKMAQNDLKVDDKVIKKYAKELIEIKKQISIQELKQNL